MAQVLKPEVRERILDAARDELAETGWQGATVAGIAGRAGVSAGNVYRYFPSREALLDAAVPDEVASRFLSLVEARVDALARTAELARPDAGARADAERMLAFVIAHRREVLVLLAGAEGSRHAGFADRFGGALAAPTLARLRAGPGRIDPVVELLVGVLFRNTVHALAGILRGCSDEVEIRRAFEGFWSYQLAGLAGFIQWVAK